ncbi:ACT domain-containing protein [Oscillospiraceae bacterium HV4-5-C5C]|nr:ACT domain-containing protein [Oscillospiraceae bacterium HV4-5-C5C]
MRLKREDEYYLVKAAVLPDVFLKVMQVKRMLNSGEAQSVNAAVRQAGLSRSAYYKYRDAIRPFYETAEGHVITMVFVIENFPGILAGISQCLAEASANVLTINQGIPINSLADVTISMETRSMNCPLEELMSRLGRINGVLQHRILAGGSLG